MNSCFNGLGISNQIPAQSWEHPYCVSSSCLQAWTCSLYTLIKLLIFWLELTDFLLVELALLNLSLSILLPVSLAACDRVPLLPVLKNRFSSLDSCLPAKGTLRASRKKYSHLRKSVAIVSYISSTGSGLQCPSSLLRQKIRWTVTLVAWTWPLPAPKFKHGMEMILNWCLGAISCWLSSFLLLKAFLVWRAGIERLQTLCCKRG